MGLVREGITEIRFFYEFLINDVLSWRSTMVTINTLIILSIGIYFYKYCIIAICVLCFTPIKYQFLASFSTYTSDLLATLDKEDTPTRISKNMAFIELATAALLTIRKQVFTKIKSNNKKYVMSAINVFKWSALPLLLIMEWTSNKIKAIVILWIIVLSAHPKFKAYLKYFIGDFEEKTKVIEKQLYDILKPKQEADHSNLDNPNMNKLNLPKDVPINKNSNKNISE